MAQLKCKPTDGTCIHCGQPVTSVARRMGMNCKNPPPLAKELSVKEAEELRAFLPALRQLFPDVKPPETY